ncbi:MAG: transcription termination/antitermination protein NusA, partial [Alphaproteobacteria bacterium]|nr:transcription termination/antitermination protein NusA [Alphaproteobacteria bacterium]
LARYREVVEGPENVENEVTQLTLEDAKMYDANAKVGDFIIDQLPPIDFGRIAAQTAKQVIVQKVRDAERNKQFEEYKEKIGTIVNGTIKRIEFGNVILDIGKTEAILRRDEIIPREKFKNGDRVRAYVLDVRRENKGPQVFLSRTCPEFMAKLFTQEVPEIYDGIVKIMGVARDPGSKAKIAVKTDDMTIDPVGACVGLRGIRVQAVVTELQGEKIDIVPYSEDKAQYIVSALSPAEVTKVVLDEENNRIEAVVPQEQFSLAIGRRGQNVKLASQLLGCDIDVLTEEQEQERRSNENKVRSQRFIEALDVDEMIAHLLIAEGFSTVDEIALVPLNELAEIEGFDEDVAAELQKRAKDFIAKRNEEFAEKSKTLGIDEQLKTVDGLDQDMILTLAGKGVKTLDDLADLAADELMEMLGENVLSEVEANKVIMKAREHWFSEETSL